MKKILITLLNLLLIGLLVFVILVGFNSYFKEFKAYSAKEIVNKTKEMYLELNTTENIQNVTYPTEVKKLQSIFTNFKTQQQIYRDKLEVSTYVYKLEKLFVKLGNKATQEGVIVKMDLINSVDGQNMYNIEFTAEGSYISIIDFISSIENDSELGFKIEQFGIKPSGNTDSKAEENEEQESTLVANFICKDILIEDVEIKKNESPEVTEPESGENTEKPEEPVDEEENND